jgi:hypothetical protein
LADTAPVDEDRFWSIVAAARDEAGDRCSAAFGARFGEALAARLDPLTVYGLFDFGLHLRRTRVRADVPALRAACWLAGDPADFDAFAAGLVTLGRDTFERVLADPDSLSREPVVRADAALPVSGVEDVVGSLYEARAGRDPGILAAHLDHTVDPDTEETDDWSRDPAEVRRRLPGLAALFPTVLSEAEQSYLDDEREHLTMIFRTLGVILGVVLLIAVVTLVISWPSMD